jgi:hypothetical protein
MQIRLVERDEIDKVKWNSCVHYATNGSIYGYLWYLDAMARDWVGLVEGDYESVMPLPYHNLVLGRQGLRQPQLVRELAVYSVNPPSNERTAAFWAAVPEVYKRVDLTVDAFSPPRDDSFELAARTNYYLPLAEQYELIRERYSQELIDQLQKADAHELYPTTSIKPEKLADLYRELNGPVPDQVFHGLQRIIYNVLHRGWGFVSGVMDAEQELLAADFFVFSHGRILSLAPCATPRGHQLFARQHLYDTLIRGQVGKPQALDFNVAPDQTDFAKSFGALPYDYFRVQRDTRKWGVF